MNTNANKRITVKSLIEEALGALFHLENKLLRTLTELAIRPGKMIRDYIEGEREKYQKPFGFLLISSVIHSIVYYLTHLKQVQPISKTASFTERYWYNIYSVQTNYFSWIHLGLLPLYSLIIIVIFYRAKYNYAEWMVAGCYLLSFLLWILIPYNILNAFIQFSSTVDFFLQLFIISDYSTWLIYQFVSQKNKLVSLFKALISVIIVFSLFLVTVRGIAYLITLNNG